MDSERKFGMTRRQFVTSSAVAVVAGSLSPAALAHEQTPAAADRPTSSGPSRVIIDTDPGVDDAFALLLAMRSRELRIEGIAPAAGNRPLGLTLPNALRRAEIAGRTDIPVAAGAKTPLTRRLVTAAYVHGENGLGGAEFPEPKTKPVGEPAPEFIRTPVRKHPGEITLITIGPLTNVAMALDLDPDLQGMIPRIVMMGGSLSGGNITPAAEFNIYVDPEAARIVFQSGIPITMVGLDVTRKTALTEAHVRQLEAGQNAVSQAAAKIARNAIAHNRQQGFAVDPHMHDSLAVAAFLDPSLLKFEDYYVDVETAGELTAGETVGYSPIAGDLRRNPAAQKQATLSMPIRGSAPSLASAKVSPVLRDKFVPNTKVAVDVNSGRFCDFLIRRLAESG